MARQAQTLAQSLRSVFSRRTTPETETKELVTRCRAPEQEPAQRTQAQEQLRAELAEQQQRLEAQAKSQQTDQASLAARTKELAAAQAAVTELESPARERGHAGAER